MVKKMVQLRILKSFSADDVHCSDDNDEEVESLSDGIAYKYVVNV